MKPVRKIFLKIKLFSHFIP